MDKSSVIGIDIGGSHITAGLVDAEDGLLNPRSLVRRKVDTNAAPDEVIGSWSEVINEVKKIHPDHNSKLGIAIPGPFNYEEGISLIRNQGKFDALFGKNVKKMLANRLAISAESIHLMNDAGCFLRGEVFSGAAKGYSRAIGITLGTGLGTAFYAEGAAEDADLWKHPFRDGIAEDLLCSRWFVSEYQRLTGRQVNGVKELSDLFRTDQAVREVFENFSVNLADFLAFFIRKEDPEVVVLGGNIANAYQLFIADLKKQLAAYDIGLPVLKAQLGEETAMVGAASYWIDVQKTSCSSEQGYL